MNAEDFWANTEPDGACLVWTAGKNGLGYGNLRFEGRTRLAHRVAFYLRMGRWPNGLLRHLCNNPPCVLHVVEGTKSENGLDAVAAGTHHQVRKTHCPQGHPYDDENTILRKRGGRFCRTCMREHNRRYAVKKRAAVHSEAVDGCFDRLHEVAPLLPTEAKRALRHQAHVWAVHLHKLMLAVAE